MSNSFAHTQLVKECLEELALMGYAAWQNTTGATKIEGRFIKFGKKGSGDILAVLAPHGRHCEIEAKTGNAVQNQHQKAHMRAVRNSGGVYLVVRSRSEIAPQLAALGINPPNAEYRPSAGAVLLL